MPSPVLSALNKILCRKILCLSDTCIRKHRHSQLDWKGTCSICYSVFLYSQGYIQKSNQISNGKLETQKSFINSLEIARLVSVKLTKYRAEKTKNKHENRSTTEVLLRSCQQYDEQIVKVGGCT